MDDEILPGGTLDEKRRMECLWHARDSFRDTEQREDTDAILDRAVKFDKFVKTGEK